MAQTNEEVISKLKQSICNYYMGIFKQKLKYLLANGKENEISSQIMQFLDAQIDTGNNSIVRDDIIKIALASLVDDSSSISESRICHSLPDVSDISIEDGGEAALLTEKVNTLFNGIEENSCYLYVSPDFYTKNIEIIESKIKKLEKRFF